MRPAVFLDRDDTLIANRTLDPPPPGKRGDLCDPALVRLLPGALEACRDLHHAGFTLVIITNQAVVARGGGTIADVEATNARVGELLTFDGNQLITDILYCPYHPDAAIDEYRHPDHPWRKPNPGMILHAMEKHALDPARSWMIGDAPRDAQAAINAGIDPGRALLIGPDHPFPDIAAAAGHILAQGDAP